MAIILAVLFVLYVIVERLGLDFFILWLAQRDSPFSPYRMKPTLGVIQLYRRGLSKKVKGDIVALTHGTISGWYYHEGDQRFYTDQDIDEFNNKKVFDEKFPDGPPGRKGRLARLRVQMIGLFCQVYERKREWNVFSTTSTTDSDKKPKGALKVKTMDGEDKSIFYFSIDIAAALESIPTIDLGSVDVVVSTSVLLIDPQKAESIGGKWEEEAAKTLRARAMAYLKGKTVSKLQQEKETKDHKEFLDTLLAGNYKRTEETATGGLVPSFGIMFFEPRLEDLEIRENAISIAMREKEAAEIKLATAKVNVNIAREEGLAVGARAQAEAEGVAAGITAEVKAWTSHPDGAQLRAAQAIEKTKLVSYGGNVMIDIGERAKEKLIKEK